MSSPLRHPEPPSVRVVKQHLAKWDTLEKYTLQEASLALLFHDACPRNDDISHVLLKVSALNDFYSTNIFDTHSVAKHILGLRISDRMLCGDPSLVDELALISIGGKQRKLYSFASKYCNHHNPESFPIFDAYVEKMLVHFRRTDRFADFRREDLRRYGRFVEIIRAFREHYALAQFTLRQIDIYLWLAGKDAFQRFKKKA